MHILIVTAAAGRDASLQGTLSLSRHPAKYTHVTTLYEARAATAHEAPTLALVDQILPDGKGCTLLADAADRFPVILLATEENEAEADLALQAGAMDYVCLEPATLAALPHLVSRALRQWSLQLQQHQTAADLHLDIHVRKQASSLKQRMIMETARDGYWLTNQQGRLLEVNETYCQMSGYSESELLAMSISDLEALETQTDIAARIQRLLTNSWDHFETRHRRKDGTIFAVEISTRALDRTGQQIVVFVEDITERKQTEAILHARLRLSEMADEHTLDEVLQLALDEAEALTGSRIGFAHFLAPDQKTLQLQMWSTRTLAAGMCKAKGKGEHYAVDRAGVWADCVATRAPLIHNDYAHLSNRKGLPPGHALIQREMVVPVLRNGLVVMIMGVGNKPTNYDEKDVATLKLLAGLAWDIVQRKRAEIAREEALTRLQKIARHVPGVIYQYRSRPDGTSSFPYISEAIRHIYGISPEEAREDVSKIFDPIHPDDQAGIAASIQESARTLTEWTQECRLLAPDGTVRWLRGNSFPEREADGTTLWHGLITDITARKQMTLALEQSEARLRRAEQVAGTGNWEIHLDTGEVSASPNAYQLYGLPAGPVSLTDIQSMPLPEYRARLDTAFRDLVEKGWPYEIDFEIRRPTDGRILAIHSLAEYDPASRTVFGVIQDITERRQAAAALRESQSLYHSLVEQLPAGVFRKDAAGRYVFITDLLRCAQVDTSPSVASAELAAPEASCQIRGMFMRPPHCPNPACAHHQNAPADFYIHRGSYKTKHDRQTVPRYQCKSCKKTFGSRRFSAAAGQHKPSVNDPLAKLLSSGVTQRRAARIMGINKATVAKKFAWLAGRARDAHAAALAAGRMLTSYVQLDEMETFEHSKLKPLSITLAVRAKTGEIIGAQAATMNCHGHMAAISQRVYGWRYDNRHVACRDVLANIKAVAKPRITIATDGKSTYPSLIRGTLPHAVHRFHVSRVKVRGARDPLFRLNHTCAKLRADVSRLARRTWSASKCLRGLQDHLDLYVAFNNGYELG